MLLFWRLVRAFIYGKERIQLGVKKIKPSRMPKLVTVQVLLFYLCQLSWIIWESRWIWINILVSLTRGKGLPFLDLGNIGWYLICVSAWIGQTQLCTIFWGLRRGKWYQSPEFPIFWGWRLCHLRFTSLLSLNLLNTLLWFGKPGSHLWDKHVYM